VTGAELLKDRNVKVKVKVNKSRKKPGVAQRVPGVLGSHIS
jgi:hypothetical protein